jgi:hypothetical protein
MVSPELPNVNIAGLSGGVNHGTVFLMIGACRKDEIVHLGGHVHPSQILYDPRIVKSVQIKSAKTLKACIGDVNMDNGFVVSRLEVR